MIRDGWSLPEIARLVGGRLLAGSAQQVDYRYAPGCLTTDSRTLQPGRLFVALRGECFDGHHFVKEAFARGAAAAADPDSIKALKQQYGMVTRSVSEVDGTEVVTLPDGVDVTKVLEELRRNPLVKEEGSDIHE